ncbi:MAG: twin-arginine translocation pathway signal protein, partial [Rubrivivax sp.]|nr:twin-arginine translocation pathway signal protein [Rubrivivax sp.]
GLSMHPLSQALQEYPEQAPHFTAIHQALGATGAQQTVQMWARLGYGPAATPSPRRGVAAHLQPAA